MLKSTAISILKSFTKEEIIKFDDFLKSPYFNKKSAVPLLFSAIRKHYPELSSQELEKEKLWAKLYPGKEYNYGVMKNLIHDLTKLAEQFITQEEYRQNEIQEFKNLYVGLSRRKLRNVLDGKNIQVSKKFSDIKKESSVTINEYYTQLSRINETFLWNEYLLNQQNDLMPSILDLKDNFVTGILSYMINVHYQAKVLVMTDESRAVGLHLLEVMLGSLPENEMEKSLDALRERSEIKHRILKCYYLAYKATINTSDPGSYLRFRDFFMNIFDTLPYHCLKDMDTYLVDSLSFLVDPGFDKRGEFFRLHEFRLRNDLITDRENQLNSSQFVPWMFLYLDDNNINGFKEYVDHCRKYLIDEDSEAALLFAEAFGYFLVGDYGIALSKSSRINFREVILKNILRKFLLMLYYELKDYEGFVMALDAHKHFLGYGDWLKKEWVKHYVKKTKIFSGLIEKLFKARDRSESLYTELLEKEIISTNIDNKKWFLRKVDELKNPVNR